MAVVATALSALLVAGSFGALPAVAAGQGFLSVAKTVNNVKDAVVSPTAPFTYRITVSCEQESCINAAVTDQIPAEFAGFTVKEVRSSGKVALSGVVAGDTIGQGSTFTGTFQYPIPGGLIGLTPEDSADIILELMPPSDLSPSWPSNGKKIKNAATATADNADPVTDSASVTITLEKKGAVQTTKSWAPKSQQFKAGDQSTITLGVRNAGNVGANELALTDPASAVATAATLGVDNPFRLVDFVGFGKVTPAKGATQVAVDAYVYNKTTLKWEWVTGTPGSFEAISLPNGVDAGEVGGIRVRQLGQNGSIVPSADITAVELKVAQRATSRGESTPADLSKGASVDNVVQGSASYPDLPTQTQTATAPFAVTKLNVAVTATKTITPGEMPAGGSAAAKISAKNTSNGPVDTLVLSDRDYFNSKLTLGSFNPGITYPDGATKGTITWYVAGMPQTESFDSGDSPKPPTGATGFDITFTGNIAQDAVASVDFTIDAARDYVAPEKVSELTTNTLKATATNSAGEASASDSKTLSIFRPAVGLKLEKKISPAEAVLPGALVTAQIKGSTQTSSGYVRPTQIVITDAFDPADPKTNFWNAFNPIRIAPTTIPAGATLRVEYLVDGVWTLLGSQSASTGQLYTASLPENVNITGLRYTFENPDGFAQNTIVEGNATFEARSTLRNDPTKPTATPGNPPQPQPYTNGATGVGTAPGPDANSPITSGEQKATAPAKVIIPNDDGGPGAAPIADKKWYDAANRNVISSLTAQSGSSAVSRLGWGVSRTGFTKVVLEDPATGADNPATTVFQGMDLNSIGAVPAASDANFEWDSVTSIELYDSKAKTWNTVRLPSGGSWMKDRGFLGYTLTDTERANTTGVRITVEPNDAARKASSSPTAPPAGSGVAATVGTTPRIIPMTWDLRNTLRVPSATNTWVKNNAPVNTAENGIIDNRLRVTGTRIVEGEPTTTSAEKNATITLLSSPPNVSITKTASPTKVVIPTLADTPAANFPLVTYTIRSTNVSPVAASYLRVTDSLSCVGDNPCRTDADDPNARVFDGATYGVDNPFERMTLTQIAVTDSKKVADQAASMVQLWKRDPDTGATSTIVKSLADTLKMKASELQDIVGVSVLFQGANPERDGGKILTNAALDLRLTTQVRSTERSTGNLVTPGSVDATAVKNEARAQSYDPILRPGELASGTNAASVALVSGELKIATTKTISPATLTEVNRKNPVTVTLGATDGNATVSTHRVTLEDSTEAFWNSFALTGLDLTKVTQVGAGDRVLVELRTGTGDDATWTAGTAGTVGAKATATLPANVALDRVTGVRLTFTKANGSAFSAGAIPDVWRVGATLTVGLRDVALDGSEIAFTGGIDNVLNGKSERTDNPVVYSPATASDKKAIAVTPGEHRLAVTKTPEKKSVKVDENNVWTLTFENSKYSFLNVSSVVDQLPPTLKWDEVDPTYSTTKDGLLSTDPSVVKLDYNDATREITFAWPAGKNRMAPGEKFTIKINLTLQPGLIGDQASTNTLRVNTVQDDVICALTPSTNDGPKGNSCAATNTVQQQAGGLFQLYKRVKADVTTPDKDRLVHGATNQRNAERECVADAAGYFGPNCIANSVVGGTDSWKLRIVNTGTEPITKATVVDILPAPGDRLLLGSAGRGSTYQALLDLAHGVVLGSDAAAGTLATWEYTTDKDACVGSGTTSGWDSDRECNATSWTAGASITPDAIDDIAPTVTAIRVKFDFAGTAGKVLPQNAGVEVEFQTINAPASAAFPAGASVTAPVADSKLINQAGAVASFVSGDPQRRIPETVGVRLPTGSLPLAKTFSGDAVAYAPTGAAAQVTCLVPSGRTLKDGTQATTPVVFGGAGKVELDTANRFGSTVRGIPVGSLCDVSEFGETGQFGETARSGGTQGVLITAAPIAEVPVITLDNRYDFTSLRVTKKVDTLADHGIFAGYNFAFELSCTAAVSGTAVTWDGESVLRFTLTPDQEGSETASRVITGIPVGATCALTETDVRGAERTNITIDGKTVFGEEESEATPEGEAAAAAEETSAPSVTFVAHAGDPLAELVQPNDIVVTNHFDTGRLSVIKYLAGEGAENYGSAEGTVFTASVLCTYAHGDDAVQTLYSTDALALTVGEPVEIDRDFPLGTVCDLTEVKTGGATSTDNPVAGSVVINGPAVTADITNHFDVGSLKIVKERTGSGVEAFGQGTYTAAAVCTWERDGETLTAPLPNGGSVELGPDNEYTATIGGILIGASCVVTETDSGLATSVSYAPQDGSVTIPAPGEDGEVALVTITNTFTTGSLEIRKSVAQKTVASGAPVTYTIEVKNTGEIEAIDVPVTDTLPAGATLVSAGDGVHTGNTITWNIASLAPGKTASFTVVVTYDQKGEYTNCAQLVTPTGPWADTVVQNPNAAGTASCVPVTVQPKPPLEPTKPPVEPSKPPVDPTKPPVDPTKPPVDPTKPPVDPTKPPVEPTQPPVDPTDPGQPGPDLPDTGSNPSGLGGLSLLLLLSGAGVLWLVRRRREVGAN